MVGYIFPQRGKTKNVLVVRNKKDSHLLDHAIESYTQCTDQILDPSAISVHFVPWLGGLEKFLFKPTCIFPGLSHFLGGRQARCIVTVMESVGFVLQNVYPAGMFAFWNQVRLRQHTYQLTHE